MAEGGKEGAIQLTIILNASFKDVIISFIIYISYFDHWFFSFMVINMKKDKVAFFYIVAFLVSSILVSSVFSGSVFSGSVFSEL